MYCLINLIFQMVFKCIQLIFHLSFSLFLCFFADGKFLSSLNPSELTYDGKSHFILKSFNTFYSKFPSPCSHINQLAKLTKLSNSCPTVRPFSCPPACPPVRCLSLIRKPKRTDHVATGARPLCAPRSRFLFAVSLKMRNFFLI